MTAAVTTTTMVGSIPSLIFANPIIFLQFLDLLQFVRYLIYIDLIFPDSMMTFFDILQQLDLGFLPNLVSNDVDLMKSFNGFYKNGIDALFLRTASDYIVGLSIYSGLFLIFFLIDLSLYSRPK